MADATKQLVTIEGRAISLSNLDKVLYPGRRFTKANVIDYYGSRLSCSRMLKTGLSL
jgi:hypothetical protein